MDWNKENILTAQKGHCHLINLDAKENNLLIIYTLK